MQTNSFNFDGIIVSSSTEAPPSTMEPGTSPVTNCDNPPALRPSYCQPCLKDRARSVLILLSPKGKGTYDCLRGRYGIMMVSILYRHWTWIFMDIFGLRSSIQYWELLKPHMVPIRGLMTSTFYRNIHNVLTMAHNMVWTCMNCRCNVGIYLPF